MLSNILLFIFCDVFFIIYIFFPYGVILNTDELWWIKFLYCFIIVFIRSQWSNQSTNQSVIWRQHRLRKKSANSSAMTQEEMTDRNDYGQGIIWLSYLSCSDLTHCILEFYKWGTNFFFNFIRIGWSSYITYSNIVTVISSRERISNTNISYSVVGSGMTWRTFLSFILLCFRS